MHGGDPFWQEQGHLAAGGGALQSLCLGTICTLWCLEGWVEGGDRGVGGGKDGDRKKTLQNIPCIEGGLSRKDEQRTIGCRGSVPGGLSCPPNAGL